MDSLLFLLDGPNSSPTVALSTPADAGTTSDTTPDLVFTGTDANSDDIRYNAQLSTANFLFGTETFETSILDSFNSSTTSGGGSIVLDTTSKVAGVNSLKLGATATGAGYVTKTLGSDASEIYVQFKIFVPTAFAYNTATSFVLLNIADNSGTKVVELKLDDYGALEVVLQGGTLGYTDTTLTLSKNTVHTVELYYKVSATVGAYKVWIDNTTEGSPSASGSSLNTGTTQIRKLNFGLFYTDGSLTDNYYVDNFIAHTAFIGSAGVLEDAISGTSAGFSGSPDNTDPFASAQAVTYTVQSALTVGNTYYWRVRGKDPTGTNTYGAWATTRSFQVTSGGTNATVTQVAASLTLSGGTQAVSSVQIASVAQVSATLSLTGGTQVVAAKQVASVAQSATTLTLSGGTQIIDSAQIASITQASANLILTSGTQEVVSISNASIIQIAANLAITGGVQSISSTQVANISQIAANLILASGTQSITSISSSDISQTSANLVLSGGTHSVSSIQNAAVIQVAANLTLSTGTQNVSTSQKSTISQSSANLVLSGGVQSITTARNASIAQSSANLILTGGTQTITTPLPSTFMWKGYEWYRRDFSGSPMYNDQWEPNNVSAPDNDDYVTLTISNPSGTSPYGAEMFTTQSGGWGYGTYMLVVGTRLDTLPSGVVFGGLFTYDDTTLTGDTAVTNNEIDVCETSDWGAGTGVNTSHNYFRNVGGAKTGTDDPYATTSDAVTTHVVKWESGRLTFDSYAGTGTSGTLLKHTVATTSIPVPANEFLDINAWVYDGTSNNPDTTPATSIILRDFSYTPPSADIAQVAANLTLATGSQSVSSVSSSAIEQITASLILTSGTQVIGSFESVNIIQVSQSILIATGTQAVSVSGGAFRRLKVYQSGVWIEKPLKVYKSGVWTEKPLKVYKNGEWV